jgi:hypothetical protein
MPDRSAMSTTETRQMTMPRIIKPDAEMEAFKADLLEAARDMKAGRATRVTKVELPAAADARARVGPNANPRSDDSPRRVARRGDLTIAQARKRGRLSPTMAGTLALLKLLEQAWRHS